MREGHVHRSVGRIRCAGAEAAIWCHLLALVLLAHFPALAQAQFEGPALEAGPWYFESFEQDYLKVSVLARGMDHPFGFAFLPGTQTAEQPTGAMLISDRIPVPHLGAAGSEES